MGRSSLHLKELRNVSGPLARLNVAPLRFDAAIGIVKQVWQTSFASCYAANVFRDVGSIFGKHIPNVELAGKLVFEIPDDRCDRLVERVCSSVDDVANR